jgi:translocation and assembly module TamA
MGTLAWEACTNPFRTFIAPAQLFAVPPFERWRAARRGARFAGMQLLFPRAIGVGLVIAANPLAGSPVHAQDAPPTAASSPMLPVIPGGEAALDPASPLQPLPDLGVDWPDLADPAVPSTATPGTVDAVAERRYSVTVEGLEELADAARVRLRFDEVSTLVQGQEKSANVAQIDRRAREDEETMRELLRAFGYYDGLAQARVDTGADGRIAVTIAVEPGPLYRFSQVELAGIAAAGPSEAALRRAFPIALQDPVDAERLTAAHAALRVALGREGFTFAKVGEPQVVVDHETRSATLNVDVTPAGARRFGSIVVRGRTLFGPKHLALIARFAPGDRYDAALLDDFRRALIATSLVSAVELTPVETADPEVVDIAVRLERAPRRTVAAEAGYGTGEGARVAVSWTHRNLIKPEGAVTFRGVAGTQEQLIGATLRRSNFKQRDQVLNAQVVASHTDRDAYDAKTFTIGAGIERLTNIIWQKEWTWSFGGELIASDERDVIRTTGVSRRRTFFIAALPTSLAYDGSDDLLNPTRGYRLSGRLSPEASLQAGTFFYSRAQIDGSAYVPVTERTSLAGRVRLGSILGASRDRIAPSRRFYSGGGGSVRGYGYQDIGPRDVDNDPVGGRSLAEFSIEARVRFGDFGVVPFLDGGNLYTQTLPRFTGLRYGAGLGVRYYTSFGPIRVDVGTPLNPRTGDARVAVYVSLGQAF